MGCPFSVQSSEISDYDAQPCIQSVEYGLYSFVNHIRFEDYTMYSKEDAIKPCPAIARVQASIQTILGLPPQAFMKVLKQLNRTALVVMSVNKPTQTVDFSLVLVNVSGPEEDHPNPYDSDRRFKFPMLRVPLEMCEKKDSLALNARLHPQVALWFQALNKGQRALLNDDFAAMQMEKKEMEYLKDNTPVEPEQSEMKLSVHR